MENTEVWDRTERKKEWFKGNIGDLFTGNFAIYREYDKHFFVPFREKFGQLVDEAGNLNVELLQNLNPDSKEFGNFLQVMGVNSIEFKKGSTQFIKDLKEFQAQAQAIKAKLEEYVKESFGELGNGFADSIISAVEKGVNAFDTFGESVSQVMKNLLKQALVTDRIKAIFDKFNSDVADIYAKNMGADPTAVFKQVKDYTLKFVNQTLKPEIQKGEAITKHLFDELEKEGIKMYGENNQTRTAQEKGVQRLTQDTGEEIAGQLRLWTQLSAESKTALLQISKDVAENYKFMQSHSAQQLKHLAGIETNTFTLHDMKKDLSAMKNTLSDMETKGIKIR